MNYRKLLLVVLALFMTSTIEMMSQDWANLARYREENTKLGLPRTCDTRVVFMGNSITEGWIKQVPHFLPTACISIGVSVAKLHLKCS